MKDVTMHNSTIVLNKNKHGISLIRRNFKNKSRVTVRSMDKYNLARYRFDNIKLDYNTKYMNWQNLDHCGGWHHSQEELVDQFMQDKKLFAAIYINNRNKEFNSVKRKIKECESMENVIVCYLENNEEDIDVILVKKGCVADYIDVEAVLKEYVKFGEKLEDLDIIEIMNLSHHPMSDFASRDNPFHFNYANPDNFEEFIFDGMLLGYPIESTIAKKEWLG